MPRRKRLVTKTLFILLAACICAGCAAVEPEQEQDLELLNNDFSAQVASAVDAFTESAPAERLAGAKTDEDVLALVFGGGFDLETLRSVYEIVKKHDITCTFFLNGAGVAEYENIINELTDDKRSVGSYTLFGTRRMQDMLDYEMIKDFVYSSALISRAAMASPEYLLCNSTTITEALLKAAKVSGYNYVIEASAVLNFQSFRNYEAARNYVQRLPDGSIIQIKLDGVLDNEEYTPANVSQDVGKEAGLAQEQKDESEEDETQRLLNVTQWICRAISETERSTIALSELPSLKAPIVLTPTKLDFSYFESTFEPGTVFDYLFYGVIDETALDYALAMLELHGAKGTFFVSQSDIENYPQRIMRIQSGGHKLGAALMPEFFSKGAAEGSLLEILKKLQSEFKVYTKLAFVPYGDTNDRMREAASALGIELIEQDAALVQSADLNALDADAVFTKLLKSAILPLREGGKLYVRLDYYKKSSSLAGELIKKCMEREGMLHRLVRLREQNKGRLVGGVGPVYTGERALSYVMYGINNAPAADYMLSRMKSMGAKGTFFVTAQEIADDPARIEAIKAAGHELGIALTPKKDMDFFDAAFELMNAQSLLENLGIKTRLVMMTYGSADKVAREAVSAFDMTLINPSISIARTADEFATSASRVMEKIFPNTVSLKRGDILYFRLDFYKKSDKLAGDLARLIKKTYVDPIKYPHDSKNESAYRIKSASSLINASLRYRYPLRSSRVLAEVGDAISPGRLDGTSREQIIKMLAASYIGTPYASNEWALPGFLEQEIAMLDATGKINTGDSKTVFLTFDDWGDDRQINQILYVLKKHDVKASFFIRTNYVQNNPNLLRAIAMDGHDLGSHTKNHVTLSNYDEEKNIYSALTDEQVGTLYDELTDSYKTLVDIAGDVLNEDGRPVVQPFFRPPTLAQSYEGMRAAADCGYKYIICGDVSTGDYEVSSAAELCDILEKGVGENEKISAGSIVVMHISPSAQYTAEGLDMFLSANKRWRFARLSDYLQ